MGSRRREGQSKGVAAVVVVGRDKAVEGGAGWVGWQGQTWCRAAQLQQEVSWDREALGDGRAGDSTEKGRCTAGMHVFGWARSWAGGLGARVSRQIDLATRGRGFGAQRRAVSRGGRAVGKREGVGRP